MNWLEKLLKGETLQGEEALEAFRGLDWRVGVQAALMLLEQGEVDEAKAVLESLLEEGDATRFDLPRER